MIPASVAMWTKFSFLLEYFSFFTDFFCVFLCRRHDLSSTLFFFTACDSFLCRAFFVIASFSVSFFVICICFRIFISYLGDTCNGYTSVRLIIFTPEVILPRTEISAHCRRIMIPSVVIIIISFSSLTALAPTTFPVFSVIL